MKYKFVRVKEPVSRLLRHFSWHVVMLVVVTTSYIQAAALTAQPGQALTPLLKCLQPGDKASG